MAAGKMYFDGELCLLKANRYITNFSQASLEAPSLSLGKGCLTCGNVEVDIRFIVGVRLFLQSGLLPQPVANEVESLESLTENTFVRVISYTLPDQPSITPGSCFAKADYAFQQIILDLYFKPGCQGQMRRFFLLLSWLVSHVPLPVDFDTTVPVALPPVRKFLCYINPQSGQGKALKIMDKVVKPILEKEAGIQLHFVVTKRQHHGSEHVRDMEGLVGYDSIIIVSGDGLMHEVLQGVMHRNDWKEIVQKVSFGIIPAGSGNGLALSLLKNFDSRLWVGDCTSSCVLTALSGRNGSYESLDISVIDVISRDQTAPPKEAEITGVRRLYSFLSSEWGALAWLDIESEKARWMGDSRFVLWGVAGVLKATRYKGRISYKPVPLPAHVKVENVKTPRHENIPPVQPYWAVLGNEDSMIPRLELMPDPMGPIPQDWITIESDQFLNMIHVNIPWIGTDGCIGPDTSLNDGYLQVSYCDTDRRDLLGYLLNVGTPDPKITNSTYSKFFPTRCFRFEPLDLDPKMIKKNGFHKHITIDGEDVEYTGFQIENLCSFLKVLTLQNPEHQQAKPTKPLTGSL